MWADEELIQSININLEEVQDTEIVPISKLIDSISTNDDSTISSSSSLIYTPWLRKIIESGLFEGWLNDFETKCPSTNRPEMIVKTKYSYDPIIKL